MCDKVSVSTWTDLAPPLVAKNEKIDDDSGLQGLFLNSLDSTNTRLYSWLV